ncbi:uncharacterized protein RJT20DRAFT_94741 [Scheffersomyces xylosifermentans]|uniref:uncharacterized protein n=1 Tax=Scheffersomyces xylosifermentans TaxID=1304137 RepID=UPI00315D80B5
MSSHSRQNSISSSIISESAHNHPQKIGPWKLGKTLGRGATGRVLLATHQTTGQKAAVKVVSKSELHDEDGPKKSSDEAGLPYGIEREIIIMKLLTHPNVLRLYDVWETSKALYLVLEYVEGGELFDLLVERGPLQEVEAIKYFRQIILGTAYCHALGICHRDLKPENLLLDASLNVKLADFGMAALESNGKLLETSCGSPHYAAPEIVSGLKYHGAASDVWSCGVILFALLTGRLPFDDENIRNLLLKVQAGSFDMPDEISYDAKDLISKMLTIDPVKRIATEKVLNHPLLNKYPIPNEDLISVKSLPHPETAHKSLGSAKNVDKQILSNLSILWHDRPQEDIVKCLLKSGPNPEKTFYALLMRYRHNQDDVQSSPKKSVSFNTKRGIAPSTVSGKSKNGTPIKKRASQISASRPTSFSYKTGGRNSTHGSSARISGISASSSVMNSPHNRFSNGNSPLRSPRSPRKSPRRSPLRYSPRKYGHNYDDNNNVPAIPKNVYNEIVAAQKIGSYNSMPPSLPSKDRKENPVVDEISPSHMNGGLIPSAKITGKRNSIMRTTSRMSKRKSLRASMTTGLKRNSITMKLLSTYAKLSGDSEWEYVDKQAKRTSATFATLCDKIFNQEEYDEEDEMLIDQEEKQAKEYERLMEVERKKHEAELKARKELEKKRKRQKRKSLLSSRKLSIMIREDGGNNSEVDITTDGHRKNFNSEFGHISQPKRKSQNPATLRSLSEGHNENDEELTPQDLENLKRRSVTQPVGHRKQTPILTRRPVSRLDPLWQAYENDELDRAQRALQDEWNDKKKKSRDSHAKKNRESMVHKSNRDSVISVIDDAAQYEDDEEYELPEPDVEESGLSEEYLNEIRKSRLLNSQLNLKAAKETKKHSLPDGPQTLIGNVKIPNVTRKSRNFTNSNKRLSVLSMYSTKESYRDLKSFIKENDDSDTDENNENDEQNAPRLRTSFADRLDKAGLVEEGPEDEEEPLDQGSIMDFDEHLANKRYSYYAGASRRSSRYLNGSGNGPRPSSQVPELPSVEIPHSIDDVDDTFVTKNDEVHRKRNHHSAKKSIISEDESTDDTDVFGNIKLPNGNSTKQGKSSVSNAPASKIKVQQQPQSKKGHQTKSMLPSAGAMLIPDMKNVSDAHNTSQPYPKVRKSKNEIGPTITKVNMTETIPPTPPSHKPTPKKPLEDTTNKVDTNPKRKGSNFLRKLSWGAKKTMEGNGQLPSPADSRNPSMEEKPRSSSFFRWFSSSSSSAGNIDSEVKRFNTILPKQEMTTALFALLNSWSNFGLKNLRNDQVGYNITGAISSNNTFNLKSCKFRITINSREFNQKSEIVCARVKGSRATTETLFKEIEKVLRKEGVMDD